MGKMSVTPRAPQRVRSSGQGELTIKEFNMKKVIYLSIATASLTVISATTAIADTPWQGEFTHVMSNRKGVTDDFCKAHVPDTFKTTASMSTKEITGDNGVKSKDLGYRMRAVGGIYFFEGTAMFSGTTDGKAWQDKVHYFGQALQRDPAATYEQGIWFTKDCKGFYSAGPA